MAIDSYHHLAKAGAPGAPLVFAFHGTGGDEHQFYGLVEQILPDAGIVSPRGDVSENGANRFFRRKAEGVYDMADLAARTASMAGFIAAHKRTAPERPVYALGYSNGANIMAALLLRNERLFDRAVLMHPLVPWTPEDNPSLSGVRILITAGRRDPICPLPLTESLHRHFLAQGAQAELVLHDGGHEVRDSEVDAIARVLTAP